MTYMYLLVYSIGGKIQMPINNIMMITFVVLIFSIYLVFIGKTVILCPLIRFYVFIIVKIYLAII